MSLTKLGGLGLSLAGSGLAYLVSRQLPQVASQAYKISLFHGIILGGALVANVLVLYPPAGHIAFPGVALFSGLVAVDKLTALHTSFSLLPLEIFQNRIASDIGICAGVALAALIGHVYLITTDSQRRRW